MRCMKSISKQERLKKRIDVSSSPIAVIGAGSWGTALALVLARNGCDVRLWGNDAPQIQRMHDQRVNSDYLPDRHFPENLTVCLSVEAVLQDVQDVLMVVPSHAFRRALVSAKSYFSKNLRLAWGTKGLDPENCQTLEAVAREVLGDKVPLAVLSGPSFATEVADNLPTAITLASEDENFMDSLLKRLSNPNFRLYKCKDVIGVELCGVVKNVLAIAVGLCDGLNLGANTRCALITRGIAELSRLLTALGGKPQTLLTLAGIGDIILTCTTDQSRNRRFGLAIGQGIPVQTAIAQIGQVVEGYINTDQLYRLAKRHNVDMPIVTTLYNVLYQNLSAEKAVKTLLSRETGQWELS